MHVLIRHGFTVSLLSYAVLHVISFFMEREWLLHLLSFTGLTALLCALVYLPPNKSPVPYFLTVASLLFGLISLGNELWIYLWEGLRQMRSVALLLIFVPMIGWVLREENYIEALFGSIQNVLKTSKRFYAGVMFTTQIIAYFLLFTVIPTLFQFVQVLLGNKKEEDWEHFKGTALLRGFGLGTLWVISIPSVVYIIDSTGASLGFTVAQGFFISVCGIVLSLVFISVHEKMSGLDYTAGIQEELQKKISPENMHRYRPLAKEFAWLFVTLFGPILVLNSLLDWGLLMVISLCIILWSMTYFVLKKKWRIFIDHVRVYLREGMRHKTQEIGLLFAAGMLINIVNESGWGLWLVEGMFQFSEQYPFIHIFWLLPFLVLLLGFLGLGPLTVMVLVGGIFQDATFPYPPELLVLSLTLGSAMTVFLSPFILPLIVLSNANGLSMWKNGFKFNIGYAIAFYVLVQIYLMVMVRIWG